MKIGIVVADREEWKPLREQVEQGDYREETFLGREVLCFSLPNGAQAEAILCGIGKVNAAAAAAHLADSGCHAVLNYGLSGGISGVARGEICVCDRFLEHDFDLTGIGYKPCEKPDQRYIYSADRKLTERLLALAPGAKTGTAVTGDTFVSDPALRDFLKTQFHAMCCDMETAAIAYVCEYAGIPFASVRRISDDAGNDAIESYREMNRMHEMHLHDLILRCAAGLETL